MLMNAYAHILVVHVVDCEPQFTRANKSPGYREGGISDDLENVILDWFYRITERIRR